MTILCNNCVYHKSLYEYGESLKVYYNLNSHVCKKHSFTSMPDFVLGRKRFIDDDGNDVDVEFRYCKDINHKGMCKDFERKPPTLKKDE